MHRSLRIILIVSWALVGVVPGSSHSPSDQDSPIIEIEYSCCPNEYEYHTTRIYPDGKYVRDEIFQEKSKSGAHRKVVRREEKLLEVNELAEIVSWAKQPDFLNAEAEYVVTTVFENPDWFAITYRYSGRKKTIKVFNFSRGTDKQKAQVPPPFLKLARWSAPYSELLK